MIRSARVEDAVPCALILGDFFATTAWLPRLHTPAEDLAFMRDAIGRGHVTVATENGIAVGFIGADDGWVTHLYLAPAMRGKGIGSALLDHAKRGQASLTLWCFQANEPARRFYESHGFAVVETTDGAGNEEGVPDVKYHWEAKA